MKRIILTLLFMSMILLAGCGNESSKQEEPNLIVEKIYMHYTRSVRTFDFDFLKFYEDNTFQGVDTSYRSYHGTYTINGNALTLNLSDKTYAGVVLDNGASITFGKDEFIDWTEHIKSTDTLFETFK